MMFLDGVMEFSNMVQYALVARVSTATFLRDMDSCRKQRLFVQEATIEFMDLFL